VLLLYNSKQDLVVVPPWQVPPNVGAGEIVGAGEGGVTDGAGEGDKVAGPAKFKPLTHSIV
jgi:hypothetical protein